jgi:hypothetical protein
MKVALAKLHDTPTYNWRYSQINPPTGKWIPHWEQELPGRCGALAPAWRRRTNGPPDPVQALKISRWSLGSVLAGVSAGGQLIPPSNGRNRCSAEVVCLVPRTAVQARYVRGLEFARLSVACRVGCVKLTVYIQAFIQRPSTPHRVIVLPPPNVIVERRLQSRYLWRDRPRGCAGDLWRTGRAPCEAGHRK